MAAIDRFQMQRATAIGSGLILSLAMSQLWQLMLLWGVVIGIGTLVMQVPTWLAMGHQSLAFMLLGVICAYLSDMSGKISR